MSVYRSVKAPIDQLASAGGVAALLLTPHTVTSIIAGRWASFATHTDRPVSRADASSTLGSGMSLVFSWFTAIGWWAVAPTGRHRRAPEEDTMTTIATARIAALGSTPARPLS